MTRMRDEDRESNFLADPHNFLAGQGFFFEKNYFFGKVSRRIQGSAKNLRPAEIPDSESDSLGFLDFSSHVQQLPIKATIRSAIALYVDSFLRAFAWI